MKNVPNSESISLNKFISATGICSRREADEWIRQKKVTINGQIAELGNRVTPKDVVKLNGKKIAPKAKPLYIAYHKPVGIVSTTDSKEPKNIIRAIKHPERLFPIGRLDKASHGLILLTNNGDIVNKILRAGNQHEKEYWVTVDKNITNEFVHKMSAGIPILGTVTLPCVVEPMGPKSFKIVLIQGLNRQIRRMTEFLGYEVVSLKRIRIMHIELQGLKPGQWRPLTPKELKTLHYTLDASSGDPTSTPKPQKHRSKSALQFRKNKKRKS